MDNLKGLPPFYIGQKVVRISDNKTHIVKGLKKQSCGHWSVNVGLPHESNHLSEGVYNMCWCGESIDPFYHGGFSFIAAKAFAPLQESGFPLIKLKKIIEEELICSN